MARTNAGADWQARIMGEAAGVPAKYIALTANSTAPSATDTVLTGELTGSLGRAAASFAYTSGSTSYTLSYTFTSDQTVTINKIGIFTAASGGILFAETLLTNPVNLVAGDTVQITETINF